MQMQMLTSAFATLQQTCQNCPYCVLDAFS